MSQVSDQAPHEHVWRFLRTVEDFWDGDETDVYECEVAGCLEQRREYIPR